MNLPIPEEQLHYADPALNPQEGELPAAITHVHYPTLGCPALLERGAALQVLLSLVRGARCEEVSLSFLDRHGGSNAEHPLELAAAPESLGAGPGGLRELWRVQARTEAQPTGLFDLVMRWKTVREAQPNAVRLYPQITGDEQVLFCGDAQYHLQNQRCLERFVERVNALEVAWIAMIGDVCDNGVAGFKNIIKLAWHAAPGEVKNYYKDEYPRSHQILQKLRHPILLVPGNHDGMAAYKDYLPGVPSEAFVGEEAPNVTIYDGLQVYRRTFGPTYFGFDWGGTRYLCANSFELRRSDRLGYHGIVANWGGWMRDEQLGWLERELASAGQRQQRKVLLIHHDPRGGSEGKRLGCYHKHRDYDLTSRGAILRSYLGYVLRNGRSGWQQEWMAPRDRPLAEHPVKGLLAALLDHEVEAVIMGHDNENWVDSYFEGEDLFETTPTTIEYPARGDLEEEAIDELIEILADHRFEALSERLDALDGSNAEASLRVALAEVQEGEARRHLAFAPNPMKEWGLAVKRAIHFVHVDDVGAYKHSSEEDFEDYGYVLARLEGGAPRTLQSCKMAGDQPGRLVELASE